VTTGVSAADRVTTVRGALPTARNLPISTVLDVFRCAQPGGVLTRGGHTEATIDLVTLAGL
jgi:3,4-dihydroxy 2-butanone 4-phosphate synthase